MKTNDLKVPLSVTKGILSAGPSGIEVVILCKTVPPESFLQGKYDQAKIEHFTCSDNTLCN